MKINKLSILTVNTFLLSPILSIPFMALQLFKKNDNFITLLVSILIGFFSLKYIPSFSNDKTRYIERSYQFSDFNFSDLIFYLNTTNSPDYLFDFYIYFFIQLGVDFKYFFLIVTSISTYLVFKAIKGIVGSSLGKKFIYDNLSLIIVVSSFSLTNLLSGIRFFLAGSIFLWFIYYFYFEKKYFLSFLFMILALSTHFSYFLFIVATIIAFLIGQTEKKSISSLKIFLLLSSLFFIIPRDIIEGLLTSLYLPTEYLYKVDLYIADSREDTESSIILNFLKNMWLYFSFVYLLFAKSKVDYRIYTLMVVFFISISFLYSIPLVFNRYLGYYKIIFSIYLILKIINKEDSRVLATLLLISYLIGFLIEIFVFRINFFESYSFSSFVTIYHSFVLEEGLPEFLN